MSNPTLPASKRLGLRLVLLTLVLLSGLVLFFWLAPGTPTVAKPAETETTP